MGLTRIEAPSVREALDRVADECGEDALVIEARPTRTGYVVLASPGRVELAPSDGPAIARHHRDRTAGFAELAATARGFGLSDRVLTAIENALLGAGIGMDSTGDPGLASMAARVLKALIVTEPTPLTHRITALVGATGAGKTTTLAKLAARAATVERESIAVVSLDTYKIAAVEQVGALCTLLRVPFRVAADGRELRAAIDAFADRDRILIDTTGRGPFDHEAIATLAATLRASDIHKALCIPAGLRERDARSMADGFAPVDADHLIITKWDETVAPGETLSLAIERAFPISYITVGQEIPIDIVAADAGVLAVRAFDLPGPVAETIL